MLHHRVSRFVIALFAAVLLGAAALAQQQDPAAKPEGLRFRFLGPAVGNRIAAVAGVPGDPSIYYVGASSGGVWKTTDGGIRWTPVFDSQPVAAIGALAVAPSDPSTVWAGTGEAWAIRDIDVMGDGVYKSVDAGQTWSHMGLDETGRIARVLVHPRNPEIVFVCAVGRTTGPQQERGVFRTTDGGQHWERVLFVDENTGCSGLAMDPNNPRTLFAGTWQVEMHTWAMFSGGPGSGVFVSRDGGSKWTRIEGHGLPKSPLGKIDVAVAPSPSTVATGRRRSPSIRSITTACITAARSSSRRRTAARAGTSSARISPRTIRAGSSPPAASSATTSASSTARSCSPSRLPRCRRG